MKKDTPTLMSVLTPCPSREQINPNTLAFYKLACLDAQLVTPLCPTASRGLLAGMNTFVESSSFYLVASEKLLLALWAPHFKILNYLYQILIVWLILLPYKSEWRLQVSECQGWACIAERWFDRRATLSAIHARITEIVFDSFNVLSIVLFFAIRERNLWVYQ